MKCTNVPPGSSLDMLMEGGEWNWQYHCRSALKGRRSAPLHWSRDVYSGRRRGRVPLCHRLLCRLTFQLVVIRSSPCLGASFPAFVSRDQIPPNRSDMSLHMYPSTIMKRSIRGGEKLEEVNYQQIFTVDCALVLFFFFHTSYMFILACNLSVKLLCLVAHGGGRLDRFA